MTKLIAFFAIFLFAHSTFAHLCFDSDEDCAIEVDLSRKISPTIKVINIISGVPLTGAGDETGGFGDVAANFVSALNLKKRFPQIEINFLVTTHYKESRRDVILSNRIIEIMAPELDSKKVDKKQLYKGINVIFLSETSIGMDRHISDVTESVVPRADLSIQFAANRDGRIALGNLTANVAFDFQEFNGRNLMIDRLKPASDGGQLPNFTFNTGPSSSGIYMTPYDKSKSQQRRSMLEIWAAKQFKKKFSFDDKKLACAYSKDIEASLLYLDAMISHSIKHPKDKFFLFIKEGNLGVRKIPTNLKVLQASNVPHEVMENLIFESDVPPLVTGDTSLSLAVSSASKGRFFLYELNDWKISLIDDFSRSLKAFLKDDEKSFETVSKMLSIKVKKDLIEESRSQIVSDIAGFFDNGSLQIKLAQYVWTIAPTIDIYKNSILYYQAHVLFEREMRSKALPLQLFEHLTKQLVLAKSWERLKVNLVNLLKSEDTPVDRKVDSALILFKLKYFDEKIPEFVSLARSIKTSKQSEYNRLIQMILVNYDSSAAIELSQTELRPDLLLGVQSQFTPRSAAAIVQGLSAAQNVRGGLLKCSASFAEHL